MHYRKKYENYHNIKLGTDLEIHHIDGNHSNNDILNLKAVTIEEHLKIHLDQEDYGAVQAILLRIKSTDVLKNISEMASLNQKKLWKEGKHNFLKLTTEIRKKAGLKTKELKLGIHKINADPEKHKVIASSGGKAALSKKAGFFSKEKHGAQFVKGTAWWTNSITKQRKRSITCPGEGWNKGMKYES